jgi:hypothetical protein
MAIDFMTIFRILVLIGLVVVQIAEYRISKREDVAITVADSAKPKFKSETPEEILVNQVLTEKKRQEFIERECAEWDDDDDCYVFKTTDGTLHRIIRSE